MNLKLFMWPIGNENQQKTLSREQFQNNFVLKKPILRNISYPAYRNRAFLQINKEKTIENCKNLEADGLTKFRCGRNNEKSIVIFLTVL